MFSCADGVRHLMQNAPTASRPSAPRTLGTGVADKLDDHSSGPRHARVTTVRTDLEGKGR